MGTKISALPAATTPDGTEVAPLVQGGVTSKATLADYGPATIAQLAAKIAEVARTDATQTFTGAQKTGVTTLTDAASIAIDAYANNAFKVTITAARVLANPTIAVVEGMAWTVRVTQDGTGGWALTFGTSYTVPTAIDTSGDAAGAERLLTCVALSSTKIIVIDSLGVAV